MRKVATRRSENPKHHRREEGREEHKYDVALDCVAAAQFDVVGDNIEPIFSGLGLKNDVLGPHLLELPALDPIFRIERHSAVWPDGVGGEEMMLDLAAGASHQCGSCSGQD